MRNQPINMWHLIVELPVFDTCNVSHMFNFCEFLDFNVREIDTLSGECNCPLLKRGLL